MERLELKAQPRTITGKAVRHMRREGLVPAVVYGHRTQPIQIQVVARDLATVLQHGGATQLIALTLPDSDQPRMSLVREIQHNPITRSVLHIDFLEVVMTEKIQTTIPLVFEGEPSIVRLGDAVVFHGIDEVEVECLPGDLVASIPVDLSGLEQIDATLQVRELQVPPAIKILTDADEVVARLLPARAEEEEVAPEASSEVEVITEQRAEQRRFERPKEEEAEE